MQRNCFALFIIDHFRLWHMTSYLLTGHPEIAVCDVRSVIVAGWIASIQSSWKLQSESAFENLFDLSLVDEIDIMRRERKPFKHIDNWILSTKTDERNIIALIVLIDTHTHTMNSWWAHPCHRQGQSRWPETELNRWHSELSFVHTIPIVVFSLPFLHLLAFRELAE